MLSFDELNAELNTQFIGRHIKYKCESISTNSDAWNSLECKDGTLFIMNSWEIPIKAKSRVIHNIPIGRYGQSSGCFRL